MIFGQCKFLVDGFCFLDIYDKVIGSYGCYDINDNDDDSDDG